MDNNLNDQFVNDLKPAPARPQFLKVLCILSFIMCGIWIILYLIGWLIFGMGGEAASQAVEKMQESYPGIQISDPALFVQEIGKVCLIGLLANIASLVGVIMMWNLNRIGFAVYVLAEIAVNFVGMDINAGTGEKSYGSLIFTIIIDIAFIIMYAANLKHMNKNKNVAVQ